MVELNKEEKQALAQAKKVAAMAETDGFKEVLAPMLEGKMTNAWKDPREVKDVQKFFYDYNVAWAMAKASEEILDWVEQNKQTVIQLENKKQGKTDNKFKIGGEKHGNKN